MVWWTEQKAHLKWLRPGMGVKRWVALLICGLALLVLAVAAVSRAGELSGLWARVQRLHLPIVNPTLEALVLFGAGSALVVWAIYGMNHAIVSAFQRADQAQVADVVYRHRQRPVVGPEQHVCRCQPDFRRHCGCRNVCPRNFTLLRHQARDLRRGEIGMLRAQIQNAGIGRKEELTDSDVIQVLEKEARKRKESLEFFRQGGRQDLVEKETRELEIIQGYLPQALSPAELDAVVNEAIRECGAASLREMGKVMSLLMPRIRGRAEGGAVQELVKKRLQ